MVKEFIFPDVGEGIHEGTIVKWHFKEGDAVKADQTIVEVETDKAVVELPAPATGTILKINYQVGQVVKVGQVLVAIGEPGEKYSPAAKAPEAKHEEKAGAPARKPPEQATAGPAAAEKAQAEEPPAPARAEKAQPAPKKAEVPPVAPAGHAMASPSTRRLARELGVDLSSVRGTGPGGRITDDDVKAAGKAPKEAPGVEVPGGEKAERPEAVTAPQAPSDQKGPKVVFEEGDEKVQLTHLRKVIAERMMYSKTHIPHACGMDYCDVTKLAVVREKEKKTFEPKGVKLTFLPFIVKAAAIALKEYPEFNANFDSETMTIVKRKKINIGIAVDTPEGLMVPVIKDIDRKSIVEIARDIEHLASLARERKLKLDDMRGGTFTITNIGSVGGMYSSPIINPPEIAIMGVHRIKDLPLVVDGRIVARKVLGLSVCFDHRVVDGAAATLFMNVVKQHLEDPDLMLVDMI